MPGPYPEPTFHPTGKWRMSPRGNQVVLQIEETTRPMALHRQRWRDATPQDLASLVQVQITPAQLRVSAA